MIEPEVEAPEATPERNFRVYQVTFVGDEQNGSYVSLVEGTPEELDALSMRNSTPTRTSVTSRSSAGS